MTPKTIATHAAGLFNAAMENSNRMAKLVQQFENNLPQHEKDARQRLRDEADQRAAKAKAQLLTKLTPEFLATLAALSRYAGQRTEDGVVVDVEEAFRLAGATPADIEPEDFWRP